MTTDPALYLARVLAVLSERIKTYEDLRPAFKSVVGMAQLEARIDAFTFAMIEIETIFQEIGAPSNDDNPKRLN